MTFPLVYNAGRIAPFDLDATEIDALEAFANPWRDPIRAIERASIRWWMESQRQYLTGRVLDFGCGRLGTCAVPQPYRDLVSGEYVGVDIDDDYRLLEGEFDAIMVNQVLEYLYEPDGMVEAMLCESLRDGGVLLLTYATCWPPTGEGNDYHRFTRQGIVEMIDSFCTIEEHIVRAEVRVAGRSFPLGGACRARKL